ncbi:hypothetical protein H6A35_01590 [Collinsella tanakaei]|nr:hypothetical protein [Collinsella tanakaei]
MEIKITALYEYIGRVNDMDLPQARQNNIFWIEPHAVIAKCEPLNDRPIRIVKRKRPAQQVTRGTVRFNSNLLVLNFDILINGFGIRIEIIRVTDVEDPHGITILRRIDSILNRFKVRTV